MARTYADILRLKRSADQTAQEVQSLPPGYKVGGKLDLRSDNRVDIYPFAANIYGKYTNLTQTHTIVEGEFIVNQLGGAWYYVYADRALDFHIDSIGPTYNTIYFADYHPQNPWRYFGKIYTNSTDASLISDVVNASSLAVEDIEASFIAADMIAVGAISSTLIATDAIIANLIADGAVGSAAIATGAVTTGAIGASAVTAAAIASDAVSTAAIGASQITATLIASDAVITRHILASSIVAAHIQTGSISATCIDVTSLTVHSLNVTDTYGRYIEISPSAGLYAEDTSGTVVHDIPNADILSGMVYGGHLLWITAPTYIGQVLQNYSDTATNVLTTLTVVNTSIAAFVGSCTNAKGVLVAARSYVYLSSQKTEVGTKVSSYLKYCTLYNDATNTDYLIMQQRSFQSQVAGVSFDTEIQSQACLPIMYDASVPYISWFPLAQFNTMASASGDYSHMGRLYVLGLFV